MIVIDGDAIERYFRSLTVAQSFAWMCGSLVVFLIIIGLWCTGAAICADLRSALLKRDAKKAVRGMGNLTDSMKAKYGFRISRIHHVATDETEYRVDDGFETLFFAKCAPFGAFSWNLENNDEGFCLFDVFTTEDGDQYIYWGDLVRCEEYITLNRRGGEKSESAYKTSGRAVGRNGN